MLHWALAAGLAGSAILEKDGVACCASGVQLARSRFDTLLRSQSFGFGVNIDWSGAHVVICRQRGYLQFLWRAAIICILEGVWPKA